MSYLGKSPFRQRRAGDKALSKDDPDLRSRNKASVAEGARREAKGNKQTDRRAA